MMMTSSSLDFSPFIALQYTTGYTSSKEFGIIIKNSIVKCLRPGSIARFRDILCTIKYG